MTNRQQPGLTIYTDASVDLQSKSGSWGAVIRGPHGEIHKSGKFRAECKCSTQAELRGIANALHIVLTNRDLPEGTPIMVMCDNLSAVEALSGRSRFRPGRAAHLRELQFHIGAMVAASTARVTFAWVKGHQAATADCQHAKGNRQADLLAKSANPLLVARKEKQAARRKRYKANLRARKIAEKEALACAREEEPQQVDA